MAHQLGYTVPFTLVHAGKCRTEDERTDTLQKLNTSYTTQKKQTTQNTASQNKTGLGLVASYDTLPGNEVGLFYKAPEPTRGPWFCIFV